MKTMLEKVKSEGKICSIYSDSNLKEFSVDYVLALDDAFVLVECYDPYGNYDGIVYKLIDKILLIEQDNKYLRMIKKLINRNAGLKKGSFDENDDIFLCLLDYALANRKICSFELQESGKYETVGEILSVNNNIITIKAYTEYGEEDGISSFSMDDVSKMSCDSLDDRKIGKLSEWGTNGEQKSKRPKKMNGLGPPTPG